MDTDSRVDDLVDRWEELRDGGRPISAEELCAASPELVPEVRRRIEILRAMDSALDTRVRAPQAVDGGGTLGVEEPDPPEVLRATAVYRPGARHGHGGLGVVFTAEQEELDRTVALKRIRADKLRDASRRRFLREAALTARLQHPGIVPIYGLGEDARGPFYTMPLIRGQTLQEAIDAFHGDDSPGLEPGRRSLRLRGLLQQFIAACNTVAYAHDQGVVHRDLKPSNIMLGPYGETLVMDWGLAKTFGDGPSSDHDDGQAPSPGASSGDVTASGDILGTPWYMSPEQARGEPVGPASDIFSLGLVLQAILTGGPATGRSGRGGRGRLERVGRAGFAPGPRYPRLPRALEAVCSKAMAAEPDERYPSARALADDVARWLADEPVTAWREPFLTRARRRIRRHRTATAAAAAALLAGLVGLGAVVGVQARANLRLRDANDAKDRALTELLAAKRTADDALAEARAAQARAQAALTESEGSRQEAEAVSTFLVEAFRSPDPSGGDREVKVVDVLDRAARRLDEESSASPATRGALLDALGQTYDGLGLYDRAASLLRTAVELRKAALGPFHRETLRSRDHLAGVYMDNDRIPEATAIYAENLAWSEKELGRDHPDTLGRRANLANAYLASGKTAKAVPMHEEVLAKRQELLGAKHRDTLGSRMNLGIAYRAAGRAADAIALDRETVELIEAEEGPNQPTTLKIRSNLSNSYRLAGRSAEMIAFDTETLRRREAVLGADHPDTLTSRNNLAIDYYSAGRIEKAIELFEQTLAGREAAHGRDHAATLMSRNNLAAVYQEVGRARQAIALHREILAVREARHGADHPDTFMTRINLALACQEAGRLAEAIDLHRSMLGRLEARLGPAHPYTLVSLNGLAAAFEELGRWAEAERLFRDVLARRRRAGPPGSPLLAADLAALGHDLIGQSRWSEAEPILRECLAIREKAVPDDWSRYDAMSLVGGALLGQGRLAEAEPLVVGGYEGMKARESRLNAAARERLREAVVRVIRLAEAQGDPAKAAACKANLGMPDLPAEVFAGP